MSVAGVVGGDAGADRENAGWGGPAVGDGEGFDASAHAFGCCCCSGEVFVGEEEGIVQVAVPLDDGIDAERYELLGDYVLARAEYAGARRD